MRRKCNVRAVVLLAALLGLLAGCAGSSPFVNPWQDMRLHISTTYYQDRDELEISGEFRVKPPKGFGRDPKKIRGYEDFYISFNGQRFARQDYNAVLPVGPRLRHTGYEFAGVLPAPGPVVAVVLVARGQAFQFDLPIERFEVTGLPARFDRNDDLVLTYFHSGEGKIDRLRGFIRPAQRQHSVQETVWIRVDKPAGGKQFLVPSEKLISLASGRVEFSFYASSSNRFSINGFEAEVSLTSRIPNIYAEAY